MGYGNLGQMRLSTALKLGRVSNLPTIWTNCLVGFAIAGVDSEIINTIIICIAFSLFYTAGMFFNDFFDYQWDKIHQPDRPIAAGETSQSQVALYGSVFIATGVILVIIASSKQYLPTAIISTLALIGCIVLYDWKHKEWPHSSWLMGCCRLLVYWTVALTVAPFSYAFAIPGLCIMGYIAGITYLARSEHVNTLTAWWPICLLGAPLVYATLLARHSPILLLFAVILAIWLGISVKKLIPGGNRSIPQSITNLLAGICLIDALILAGKNYYSMAALGLVAFILTVFLQMKVKAT